MLSIITKKDKIYSTYFFPTLKDVTQIKKLPRGEKIVNHCDHFPVTNLDKLSEQFPVSRVEQKIQERATRFGHEDKFYLGIKMEFPRIDLLSPIISENNYEKDYMQTWA